ncbi:MAG TPA: protein kinase [Chthoniobacterales bacterium]|nr:protein kinase [Chthoniobacterales bacterium]
MDSTRSGAQLQSCPSCGHAVETTGFEPLDKVDCPACGHQLRVERVFENYAVIEPLGAGGMGSVYKARDTRLNRFVALKLLRKEFATDAAFIARLQEEARVTASIKHPHVVEIYSVGEDHRQFYIVMELVDGGSLDDRLEDGKRISEVEALELGLQVASGLQAALYAGLIHRDIKPGNILFADRHTAKIADFGLALLAAQHAETEGEIWGTPGYVAPERLTNAREDFRSDLYSLGATLFHAVSGHPIFENETHSAAELQELKSKPQRLQMVAPDISDQTGALIDRMVRPNPADRQGSYEELIEQLQAAHSAALARGEEVRASGGGSRRVLVSLGILLLLTAVGFGISLGLRRLPRKTAGSAPEATISPAANRQTGTSNEETKVGAHIRELSEQRRSKKEAKDAAAEAPQWQAALAAERKALATYRFDQAVEILESIKLQAPSLRAERDHELQRALWLLQWKTKLISDINQTGFAEVVTDREGLLYKKGVRRATPNELELRRGDGSVMSEWVNLSPEMLLGMATSFVRPGMSDNAERQWLSAIFAAETDQIGMAQQLAAKAARAKPEFRDLLRRFFPEAAK